MIQPTATHHHHHAAHGRPNPSASAASVLGFALPGEPEGDALAGTEKWHDLAGDGNALPACVIPDLFAALIAFPISAPSPETSPTALADAAAAPVASPAAPFSVSLAQIASPATDTPVVAPQVSALEPDHSAFAAIPSRSPDQVRSATPPIAFPLMLEVEPQAAPVAIAPPDIPSAVLAGFPAALGASAPIAPSAPPATALNPGGPAPLTAKPADVASWPPADENSALERSAPAPLAAVTHAPANASRSAAAATVTAPAGVVFAAAKMAAQTGRDQDQAAPVRAQGEPLEIIGGVEIATLAPAAAAAADGSALDLTQHGWPEAMIERIEGLRDAADAADTSIRLFPDALGSIEVGLQQDGDTLHVRFTANEAQTRALLQDAQPRLAEAAEARGLRLGQTSVDAGASGQPQGQSRQHPADTGPRRPASAVAASAEDLNTDDRIA